MKMVGDPVKDKEMMEKYSPVFHVGTKSKLLSLSHKALTTRV